MLSSTLLHFPGALGSTLEAEIEIEMETALIVYYMYIMYACIVHVYMPECVSCIRTYVQYLAPQQGILSNVHTF